jgi:hypothetical protein
MRPDIERIKEGYDLSKGYIRDIETDILALLDYIDKLETALNKASETVAEMTGSCPLEHYNIVFDCANKCNNDGIELECWKQYFSLGKE